MTGREIAAVAQVSARTVHRVAAELYPDKHVNGRKTTYSREESVAIMNKLRKPGFVAASGNLDNLARTPSQNGKVGKINLSGAFLSELRKMYPSPRDAAARLDHLIGFQDPLNIQGPCEEKAPLAIAEPAFRKLKNIGERGPDQPQLEERA